MSPPLGLLAALLAAPGVEAPLPTPVVVELFSSEGCSSCPDADAVLKELDQSQPVAGVRVVALELHVDYWNQLGWADPFSSPTFTQRQARYASAFDESGVYTPQMVIDGARQFVGSERGQAREAIAAAAAQPHPARVTVGRTASRLSIAVANAGAHDAVVLAFTESELSTQVPRGENAGHTLAHGPVVRELRSVGEVGEDGRFTQAVDVPPELLREHVRAVVFTQDRRTLRIHGATMIDLGH